jgi:hypothetical protein
LAGDIPTKDSSYLERRLYELHNCKLKDLTIKDIDLYVEQEYGLKFVIPKAIDILDKNIMTETDYEGALLLNILNIDADYWLQNPSFKIRLLEICENNLSKLENIDTTEEIEEIKNDIMEAFKAFKGF